MRISFFLMVPKIAKHIRGINVAKIKYIIGIPVDKTTIEIIEKIMIAIDGKK